MGQTQRGKGREFTVTVRMFIPYMNMKGRFEAAASRLEPQNDTRVGLLHVFSTSEPLSRYGDADVLVAKDITYDRFRYLFPEKHVVEIQLSSLDILKTLICARQESHPKEITLCVRYMDESAVSELEKLCQAEIAYYMVHDEAFVLEVIHSARISGANVFVGVDTICELYDKEVLNRVHIHTKDIAIEQVLKQAMGVARAINMEWVRSKIASTILNASSNALTAVSGSGLIQALNNQVYCTFQLSPQADYAGRPVEEVYPALKWKDVVETGREREEATRWKGRRLYMGYRPVLMGKMGKGAIIVARYTERIIETETKIWQSPVKQGLTTKYSFDDTTGSGPTIRENILMTKRYSQVSSSMLIMGETGIGKRLSAHSIHRKSRRSTEPPVTLSCAALPEDLLESELFGYEPGTFSGASKNGKTGLFELAHRGTIFLDEIGEIPISLQAELLRVLQGWETRRIGSNQVQPVDVCVISATNTGIEEKIQEGQFHVDLYYRLNLLNITIPSLREKEGDIRGVMNFYLTRSACEMRKPIPRLSKEAVDLMTHYGWPGSVRELHNICEHLIVLSDTTGIGPREIQMPKIFRKKEGPLPGIQVLDRGTDQPETGIVYANLEPRKKKQNIMKELGVSRTALWRMEKMAREQKKR